MLEKAKELIKVKKYRECVKMLEQVENPSLECLKLLVNCYVNLEQYENAVKLCQSQFKKSSTQKEKSDWQYRLADVYLHCKPEMALLTIEEYLSNFKTSIHGHALAIYICTKLSKHGEAEKYYKNGCEIVRVLNTEQRDRFSKIVAKLHKAYAKYLETVSAQEHDPGKAVEASVIYKIAAESDPVDFNIWYDLSKVLFEINNWQEAENAINEALKLRPDEPYVIRFAAKIASAKGDNKTAIKNYQAISPHRQQGYILIEMGQCFEQLGELKKAGQCYKQAIGKDANKHYYHLVLGKLYKRMGAKVKAIEQFNFANDLCRSENGLDHKVAKELIGECEKMTINEDITFRDTVETSKKKGKIIKYVEDRGFGFIEQDNYRHFFHISSITDRRENGDPKIGQVVLFLIIDTPKGSAATGIIRVKE